MPGCPTTSRSCNANQEQNPSTSSTSITTYPTSLTEHRTKKGHRETEPRQPFTTSRTTKAHHLRKWLAINHHRPGTGSLNTPPPSQETPPSHHKPLPPHPLSFTCREQPPFPPHAACSQQASHPHFHSLLAITDPPNDPTHEKPNHNPSLPRPPPNKYIHTPVARSPFDVVKHLQSHQAGRIHTNMCLSFLPSSAVFPVSLERLRTTLSGQPSSSR